MIDPTDYVGDAGFVDAYDYASGALADAIGLFLETPCEHGWRRWWDRLLLRDHPARHRTLIGWASGQGPGNVTVHVNADGTVRVE